MIEPVSPASLAQEIQSVFCEMPLINCRSLNAKTDSGNVILQGRVDTYYQKQMAQELVRQIVGVQSIENQVVVNSNAISNES